LVNNYNIKLKIKFECLKKLAVGAPGQTGPEAEVMFLRAGSNLLVPSSEVKGILRTNACIVSEILGMKTTKSVIPQDIESSNDIVTRVFGGPGRKSKISVIETKLNSANQTTVTTIITHVSIEEKTSTSIEGGIYSVEYLPPGTILESSLEGVGLSLEEAELLFASLAACRYSRFARDCMVCVSIVMEESQIPQELLSSEIISNVIEVIRVE
jgi:CRISPR/Cas system CMR subunit Cmr4 (Cas7 group RAMP superfamily)